MRLMIAALLLALAAPVLAQTTGPIRVHTSGIKISPDGGTIPAATVMADSGLMPSETSWAVMFQCSGAPKSEGNPPTLVGGDGVYTYERYNISGVVGEPVSIVHEALSQGGNKSISPAPIVAPSATTGPILVVHKSMSQGGNQSIPPLTLQAGEGLRIRTATPLKGILSCAMFMYVF